MMRHSAISFRNNLDQNRPLTPLFNTSRLLSNTLTGNCSILTELVEWILFWPAFIWRFLLEKKNSASYLLKTKWLMKICISEAHQFSRQLLLQVNLCQKLLFLHQLTHNMTTDCSFQYMKILEIVSDIQNNLCTQHVLPMFCKNKSFWQRFTYNKRNIIEWDANMLYNVSFSNQF